MCSWVISSCPYSFSLLKRKKRTRTRTTCQVVQAVTPLTRCPGSLSGRGWKRYTAQPWNFYPERVYQNYQGYNWIWIQGWKYMGWSLICESKNQQNKLQNWLSEFRIFWKLHENLWPKILRHHCTGKCDFLLFALFLSLRLLTTTQTRS